VKLPTDLSGQELVEGASAGGISQLAAKEGATSSFDAASAYARVVVPDHKRVRPGTLHQILNEAGLTVEQLSELRSTAKGPPKQQRRRQRDPVKQLAVIREITPISQTFFMFVRIFQPLTDIHPRIPEVAPLSSK
jgi:hypothetical protein